MALGKKLSRAAKVMGKVNRVMKTKIGDLPKVAVKAAVKKALKKPRKRP